MDLSIREKFNKSLDKLIRPEVSMLGRPSPAFQVCGVTGLAVAMLLALILLMYLGLSRLIMAAIVAAAAIVFLGLVMATKIITGQERIIYYHHEIAVMTAAALFLWLTHQPMLPYLDVTILGIGAFLFCGRVGCLMVGCCHGRPYHWGVRYRTEHREAGFTPYLVGVRLFPIQAVESLWVFCLVVTGITFILRGWPPGTALVWYTVAYGLGRFFFEFMRGDPERPYYLGLSQPQWISTLSIGAVVWAGLSGGLSLHPWHLGVATFLAVTVIAICLRDRSKELTERKLFHAHHIHEFAEAIQLASDLAVERCDMCKQIPATQDIHIACTHLGIQVSASRIKRGTGYIHHYSICYQNGIMSEEAARLLTEILLQMKHPFGSSKLIKGPEGVFHLLVHTPPNSVALMGVVDELIEGADGNRTSSPYRRSEETPSSPISRSEAIRSTHLTYIPPTCERTAGYARTKSSDFRKPRSHRCTGAIGLLLERSQMVLPHIPGKR